MTPATAARLLEGLRWKEGRRWLRLLDARQADVCVKVADGRLRAATLAVAAGTAPPPLEFAHLPRPVGPFVLGVDRSENGDILWREDDDGRRIASPAPSRLEPVASGPYDPRAWPQPLAALFQRTHSLEPILRVRACGREVRLDFANPPSWALFLSLPPGKFFAVDAPAMTRLFRGTCVGGVVFAAGEARALLT